MLHRNERRRLAEIESWLSEDDPEFAHALTDARPHRWFHDLASPRMLLTVTAALVALLCLVLAQGGGFFLAGVLAVVLFFFRNWSFQSE